MSQSLSGSDMTLAEILSEAEAPASITCAHDAVASRLVGARNARRSFEGGAPRARPPAPVLNLRPVGTGSGLAAEYAL